MEWLIAGGALLLIVWQLNHTAAAPNQTRQY
jgi:hypothetical protein